MTNIVRYSSDTGRSPSPKIFGDMSKIRSDADRGKCIFLFDDFVNTTAHANDQASGGYHTIADTNVTIRGQNTVSDIGIELGVLELATNATDNQEGYVSFGWGNMFRIGNAAGNTGKVGFEARITTNTIADNEIGYFVGLMQGPAAANYLIDDTAEPHASRGLVGFLKLQADGDKINATYKASGQTRQNSIANAATPVANTYINLGFLYDPNALDTRKIKWFVDGVEGNAYVTTTNIDAATFPDGVALHPFIGIKNGAATATKMLVDWVAAYQYGNLEA